MLSKIIECTPPTIEKLLDKHSLLEVKVNSNVEHKEYVEEIKIVKAYIESRTYGGSKKPKPKHKQHKIKNPSKIIFQHIATNPWVKVGFMLGVITRRRCEYYDDEVT